MLDLYADLESSQRCRHVLIFRKLRSISFAGDCFEIARNYFAGVIQDGFIEDANGFQKLSMQLTGGALVIEGLLEIGASRVLGDSVAKAGVATTARGIDALGRVQQTAGGR